MSVRARLVLAFLLALAILVITAMAGFIGIAWGFGAKCDDTCGEPPPWRDDRDAWQWTTWGWTGIGAFACAAVFLLAVERRRRLLAAVAGASWLALAVPYLVLLDQSEVMTDVHKVWMGFAPAAAAVVVAAALTPVRHDD